MVVGREDLHPGERGVGPDLDPAVGPEQPVAHQLVAVGGRAAAERVVQRHALERASVAEARSQSLGLWGGDEPLRLFPFELRFLARLSPPERWVIDVAARDDRLLAPQLYTRIDRPEDRLFVGAEFVPLFESRGWRPVRS